MHYHNIVAPQKKKTLTEIIMWNFIEPPNCHFIEPPNCHFNGQCYHNPGVFRKHGMQPCYIFLTNLNQCRHLE